MTNNHPNPCQRRKALLTPEDVRNIRSSVYPRKDLAWMYNVGVYTIRDIQQYRTWAWLD